MLSQRRFFPKFVSKRVSQGKKDNSGKMRKIEKIVFWVFCQKNCRQITAFSASRRETVLQKRLTVPFLCPAVYPAQS